MEIKVLFENSRINLNFKSGHGLSLLINYSGKKYLFDAGANKKLVYNATKMGETLNDLEAVIISHGHSDHTGGLRYLKSGNAPIYTAEGVTLPHYLKILTTFLYVGIPKNEILKMHENLHTIKTKTELAPSFHIIPLGKANSTTKNLYKKMDDKFVYDDFSDELLVVIEQEDGLSVFTGCSHHGIIDMMEIALETFPTKPIKYLIGGFHMIGIPYINNLGLPEQEVMKIGNKLNDSRVEKILTCHCTGSKAFTILKTQLGNKLEAIKTGQHLEIS